MQFCFAVFCYVDIINISVNLCHVGHFVLDHFTAMQWSSTTRIQMYRGVLFVNPLRVTIIFFHFNIEISQL